MRRRLERVSDRHDVERGRCPVKDGWSLESKCAPEDLVEHVLHGGGLLREHLDSS